MGVACVYVPHFALRMALLERPGLDGTPLVLTSPPNSRVVVADCTREAMEQGVKPGMPLREVTALCPEVVFIQPNPARDAAAFDRIVAALETFSPLVEPGETGCCYVDLQGLERHDATVEDAMQRLLGLVPRVLRPRAGVAPGKFAAWVAARRAPPGGVRVVAPGEVVPFLAPVPVDWLPVPDELRARLGRLGLRTLGEFAALPMPAVQARFGPEGRRGWEVASGHDDTAVCPHPRIETVVETLTLPAPATSRETLLIGLKRLIVRAFGRPELRFRHVRQARLRVLIEENRSWEKEMTFREPVGRERAIEVLGHRLATIELPGAAEAMALELIGLTAETAHQELLPGALGALRSRRTRPLVEVARQLKQRYGESPLYRVVEVEPWSRIPERRHALLAYDP
ncbi:MAG TPA: DNA polymerase Y family protein [Thermomicrobiales bacterium]|jgi:DNA polymerase-4/protein ImuB